VNRLTKVFFQYGFFFLFPITAVVTHEFTVADYLVNSEMLWMSVGTCLLAVVLVKRGNRIRISGVTKALFAYYLFVIGNSAVRGYTGSILFVKTDVALCFLSLCMVLLMDNLDFDVDDEKAFFRPLPLLVLITFIGTLLQVYVDNSLFFVPRTYDELQRIDFLGFWRHGSIFDSMMQDQGFIGFIMMTMILAYRDLKMENRINMMSVLLLLVVGYFTYTRYVMLSMLFIVVGYFYFVLEFKRASKATKGLYAITAIVLLSLGLYVLGGYISGLDIFHDRILADISGRLDDPLIFLKDHLREHPLVFGTGFSSYTVEWYYGTFRRLHSGIWDLVFQGGIVGLTLFIMFLYQVHKRAMSIYRRNGNPTFLLFAPAIFGINLTARFNLFFYWGYLLVFYYMCIQHQLSEREQDV
jgi:hypothetical protein